jgi:GTP cyclohydrolase I
MQATSSTVDQDRIAAAVREMIAAIGENGSREGLLETPERIGRMYAELFSGLDKDPLEPLRRGFQEQHKEMVILRGIPFYSLCEHHFLPFHGEAHVGYVPEGRIVGVSKLARVVDILARRPQMQERLTLPTRSRRAPGQRRGCGEAQHLCMLIRGVQKSGTR